jgi:hypothetical protein
MEIFGVTNTRKTSGAWQKYAYNRTYGIIRAKNGRPPARMLI